MKIKPETAKEVEETYTIDGMRRRIEKYSLFNPIVQSCYNTGRGKSLSREDTMTLIAYHYPISKECKLLDGWPVSYSARPVKNRPFHKGGVYAWHYEGDIKKLIAGSGMRSLQTNGKH